MYSKPQRLLQEFSTTCTANTTTEQSPIPPNIVQCRPRGQGREEKESGVNAHVTFVRLYGRDTAEASVDYLDYLAAHMLKRLMLLGWFWGCLPQELNKTKYNILNRRPIKNSNMSYREQHELLLPSILPTKLLRLDKQYGLQGSMNCTAQPRRYIIRGWNRSTKDSISLHDRPKSKTERTILENIATTTKVLDVAPTKKMVGSSLPFVDETYSSMSLERNHGNENHFLSGSIVCVCDSAMVLGIW